MRLDVPGVGQHLQDHLMVPVAYHCTQPVSLVGATDPAAAQLFQEQQKGLLSSNIGEGGGFVKLSPDSPVPDFQFYFAPGWFVLSGAGNPKEGHGFTLLGALLRPKSSGSVTLKSADPADKPLVFTNYLSDKSDLMHLVEGVKLSRKVLSAPSLAAFRGEEFLPGKHVTSDADIAEHVRNFVQTIYHPTGTCRMGPLTDGMAVVDHELRVKVWLFDSILLFSFLQGTTGLRVADASIFPEIPNANTNFPTMMVAEKLAFLLIK